MKREMDSWRGFIHRTELLENKDYIQYVLGIKIPLNESTPFSSALSQRILQEQLLLEGFFDKALQKISKGAAGIGSKALSAVENVKSWSKAFGQQVGKLLHSLWTIFRNPEMLPAYIKLIEDRFEERKGPTLRNFGDTVVELFQGTETQAVAQTIKNTIDQTLNKFETMQGSWKKALVGSGLTVISDYMISRFKEIITQVNNFAGESVPADALKTIGKILKEQVLDFLKNQFVGLISQASKYMTGIGAWVDWIQKIVGGVDYVAKSLWGISYRFVDGSTMSSPSDNKATTATSTPDVSPAQ